MVYLLENINPNFLLIILAPSVVAIMALALRMACVFAAVQPPDFYQAVLSVILIIIANVVLQYFLHVTQSPSGLGSQLLAPLFVTTLLIAISLPASPFSALVVAVSHLGICIVAYQCLMLISEMAVKAILA